MVALAVVGDLSSKRVPGSAREVEELETDAVAEFVLARMAAGLADSTIQHDLANLEQLRLWFGRPLWEMRPKDADAYFGKVLRTAAVGTRLAKAQTLATYFDFLDLRYRSQLYALTGVVVACPLDELNRPRGRKNGGIRIPPTPAEMQVLEAGWRSDLATCRKFAPAARSFAAAKLMMQVGLRINEVRKLDLTDARWDLGRFGKLNVRFGKGHNGSGPKTRMTPMINGADAMMRWYIEDVWGLFGDDYLREGAPIFPSERRNADGTCKRVTDDGLRYGLEEAVIRHLPHWKGRLTPHVLRHFCASQLYNSGMDLHALQQLLGHSWVTTTMGYVHPYTTHVEDAYIAGCRRGAVRLQGLAR
jgi:integrase/recombinase XerD